jgi:hypothetical protein
MCATQKNTKYPDMATTISKQVHRMEERISRIKRDLDQLGSMRPGAISRQYRNPKERKTPFYQISYTHQMKSRTEYLRKENLKAVKLEVANFKRFRKLVDQWADVALKLSQLKTRLGLHSSES